MWDLAESDIFFKTEFIKKYKKICHRFFQKVSFKTNFNNCCSLDVFENNENSLQM